MLPTSTTLEFLSSHRDADPLQLLLQKGRYPDVDMNMVAQQIEGRRQALHKWPSFLACDGFLFPPKLNREQSSSEATARYKGSLISGDIIADLTGGMGVDCYYGTQHAKEVHYVEMNPDLVELAEHNFAALGRANIQCHCGDSIQWLSSHPAVDVIIVDPARRNENGKKVSAFEDCAPNILEHRELLRTRCTTLIVKASPMIDIEQGVTQLGEVAEVHVVAVGGECKEVLFLCRQGATDTQIHCVNLNSVGEGPIWTFSRTQEQQAQPRFANALGRYLYEPDASLMKGGAYRIICEWFPIAKLSRNSHLYTSDELISDFPGRTFQIEKELSLSQKTIKKELPEGNCHIVCRNYPLSAPELQKKLRLKEGNSCFIVATRLGETPIGIKCKQVITD